MQGFHRNALKYKKDAVPVYREELRSVPVTDDSNQKREEIRKMHGFLHDQLVKDAQPLMCSIIFPNQKTKTGLPTRQY